MSPTPSREDLASRVAELHAAGLGRNQIARELGVGGRIITELARELSLTFDRRRTRTATDAREADSRERRSKLAARILDAAEADLERITALSAPQDALDAERRTRGIANIARAVESTIKAAPIVDEDPNSIVRDAVKSFTAGLQASNDLYRRLEAYEALYGPIDVPDDTYGRPPADAP